MNDAAIAELAAFARAQARVSWFVALGNQLDAAEEAEARDYLAALGLSKATIHICADWREAEAALHTTGHRTWWDAEERERQALLREGERRLGKAGLMQALTRVTSAASDVALGAASVAAARFGVSDPVLSRVAAGAATEAGYHAALAIAAGRDAANPFAIKFRLFAAGHWPLGVADGRFRIF